MKKGDDKKGDSPNFLSEKGTVPFFILFILLNMI